MEGKCEIDVQFIERKPGKQSKVTNGLGYDVPLRNRTW